MRSRAVLSDEAGVVAQLIKELGLNEVEARLYLWLLKDGSVPASRKTPEMSKLLEEGMVILSGDNSRFIPVHPRLAIANHFRTWRETMVREINERRMRVDKLILKLIPVYETTAEKRLAAGKAGGRDD